MEIGVNLPNAGSKEFRDTAALVDRLGLDSVWVGDHVVMPSQVNSYYPYASDHQWPHPATDDWYDPLLSLAWAGAATSTVQLGTAVLVLPLRDPIILAKQVASLSAITGRRVLLGVGVGWMKEEFDALHVAFGKRGRRAEEMVDVMRRLWSGRPVSFEGEFFAMDRLCAHPIPTQPPLILWGGHSSASLRHVARVGDGWYPLRLTRDEFQKASEELRAVCDETGRDPKSLTVCVGLGPSRNLTAEACEWYFEHGAQHVVCRPPLDPDECREELVRVAALRSQYG